VNPLDFIGAHIAVGDARYTSEVITLDAKSEDRGACVIVTLCSHTRKDGVVTTGKPLRHRLTMGAKTVEDAFPFTLAEVIAAGVSPEAGRKAAYQLLWLLMRRDAGVRQWVASEAPVWWACVRDAVEVNL